MKHKTDFIHMRVSLHEKHEIQKTAQAEGLDDMTGYLLWLHRKFKRNEKNNLQKITPPLDKGEETPSRY